MKKTIFMTLLCVSSLAFAEEGFVMNANCEDFAKTHSIAVGDQYKGVFSNVSYQLVADHFSFKYISKHERKDAIKKYNEIKNQATSALMKHYKQPRPQRDAELEVVVAKAYDEAKSHCEQAHQHGLRLRWAAQYGRS